MSKQQQHVLWLLLVVQLVVALCTISCVAGASNDLKRIIPILSRKYQQLNDLKKSASDVRFEIQLINATTASAANVLDNLADLDYLKGKINRLEQLDKLSMIFERETQLLEKYVLDDGSVKSCEDVLKLLSDSTNVTSGIYSLIDVTQMIIKREFCSFNSEQTKQQVTDQPSSNKQPIISTLSTNSLTSNVGNSAMNSIPSNGVMLVKDISSDASYANGAKLYKPASFSFFSGIREDNGVISKKLASNYWSDSGFFSKDGITETTPYQGISFKAGHSANQVGLKVAIALSQKDTNFKYMQYQFHLGSTANINENGGPVGSFGSYEEGDEFRIHVCNNNLICYAKNGKVLYVSGNPFQYPLYVECTFFKTGSRVVDVGFIEQLIQEPTIVEIGQPIYFTKMVNSISSAGFIQGKGKGSGGSSTLSFGNYFQLDSFSADQKYSKASLVGGMSFKVGEAPQDTLIGLVNGPGNSIRFGVKLTPSGYINIADVGGPFLPYLKDDVFTVQLVKDETGLANDLVVCTQNGKIIYVSKKAAAYPLFVAIEMNAPGSIYDLSWIGKFELNYGKVAYGERVQFPFLRGFTYTDGILLKIARENGCNAFASSIKGITKTSDARGFTFKVSQNTVGLNIGLTNRDDDYFNGILYGFSLKPEKTVGIYDGLGNTITLGGYEKGDQFSVVITSDNRVNCLQNGEIIYTSDAVAMFPLKVFVTIEKIDSPVTNTFYVTENGVMEDVPKIVNPGQPVYWKHVHGMKSKPGYQRKILNSKGWDAGSFSYHSITETLDIGGITFKPTETTKDLIMGLSSYNTHTDYKSINFGILLSFDAQVQVYEMGEVKGIFGKFAANDRFDIRVSNDLSQVLYLQNNLVFYTSSKVPSFPLSVDNSFYYVDSCVYDIMWTPHYSYNQTNLEPGNFVYFKNIFGVDVSMQGQVIKRKVSNAWDATAFSSLQFDKPKDNTEPGTKQVYGVSFVATMRKSVQVALSNTDKGINSDFAIRLTIDGSILIAENGEIFGHSKKYDVGDSFSIYVSNDLMYYTFNGEIIYISKKQIVYPLGVSVAILEVGASVDKLTFISNTNEIKSAQISQRLQWKATKGFTADPGLVVKQYYTGSWEDTGLISSFYIDTQQALYNYSIVGGISFKVGDLKGGFIGLTTIDSELQDSNAIENLLIFLDNGAIAIKEKGKEKGIIHNYLKGDEFSIRITSTYDMGKQTVIYLQNGNVFYTSALQERDITLPSKLYVRVGGVSEKFTLYDIVWTSAFKPEESVEETILPASPISKLSNVVGIERYEKIVSSVSKSFIRKQKLTNNFDSGFYTARKYIADGSNINGFSFKTLYNTNALMIGLTSLNSKDEMTVAISLGSNKILSLYEGSTTLIGTFGEYVENDEFTMLAIGTGKNERYVVVLKNGAMIYSNTIKIYRGPFGVAASFQTVGAAIYDLVYVNSNSIPINDDKVKGGSPVKWDNVFLVECKDGQASRLTGSGSWNSGVISSNSIGGNESSIMGFSFVASQTEGQTLAIGLTNDVDYTFGYNKIDYAIYLKFSDVQVYENGVKVTIPPTSFRKGDIFDIKIVNNTVYYLKEGSIIYTSKILPNLPLKLQASFFSDYAQVSNVQWIAKPTSQ